VPLSRVPTDLGQDNSSNTLRPFLASRTTPMISNPYSPLIQGVSGFHARVVIPTLRSLIPDALLGLPLTTITHNTGALDVQQLQGHDLSADYLRIVIYIISNNLLEEEEFPLDLIWEYLQKRASEWLPALRVLLRDNAPTASVLARVFFRCAIMSGDASIVGAILTQQLIDSTAVDSLVYDITWGHYTPLELSLKFGSPSVTTLLLNKGSRSLDLDKLVPDKWAKLDGRTLTSYLPGLGSSVETLLILISIDAAGGSASDHASDSTSDSSEAELPRSDYFLEEIHRASESFDSNTLLQCIKAATPEQIHRWEKAGCFSAILEDIEEDYLTPIMGLISTLNGSDHMEAYLQILTRRGQLECVKSILSTHAWNPVPAGLLVTAVQCGERGLFDTLVAMGADTFGASGHEGRSPYSEAIEQGNLEFIEFLEDRNVIDHLVDEHQWVGAWWAAVRKGNEEVLDKLRPRISTIKAEWAWKLVRILLDAGEEDDALSLLSSSDPGNATINSTPEQTYKLLELATKKEQPKVVRALLERDIVLDPSSSFSPRIGPSTLTLAVNWGDQSIVRDIIAATICSPSACGEALCAAIKKRDKQMSALLLDLMDEEGSSDPKTAALTDAVETGDASMVEYLFSQGADPCNSGALRSAVSGTGQLFFGFTGNIDQGPHSVDMAMVRLLVSHFRERYPRGVKSYGSGALCAAIESQNSEVFEYLIRNKVGICGMAPLTAAIRSCRSGNIEMVRKVLQIGMDADGLIAGSQDMSHHPWDRPVNVIVRETPLLQAIPLKNISLLELLIEFGASINFPATMVKRTPLQKACEVGDLEIVQFFVNHGAEINAPPALQRGATALQLAAISGRAGTVDFLLRHGAHVNAPAATFDGRTALEGAAEHGRLDIVQILINSDAGTGEGGAEQVKNAMNVAKKNGHIEVWKLIKTHFEVNDHYESGKTV